MLACSPSTSQPDALPGSRRNPDGASSRGQILEPVRWLIRLKSRQAQLLLAEHHIRQMGNDLLRKRILTLKGHRPDEIIKIVAPQALPFPEARDSRSGRCHGPQASGGDNVDPDYHRVSKASRPGPPGESANPQRVSGTWAAADAWRRCACRACECKARGNRGTLRSHSDGCGPRRSGGSRGRLRQTQCRQSTPDALA